MKNFKKGFTLIELLVVVAIIGILASVVLVSLNSARSKGNDAAVKTNLHTVANQAELYYSKNGSYSFLNSPSDKSNNLASTLVARLIIPPGGGSPCPSSFDGTSMFSKDKVMFDALTEAIKRGNGGSCYSTADAWAVAVGLTDTSKSWCVDATGAARQVSTSSAINSSTYQCN